MKKGQSALEFVVLVSFMLAVFFIFFIVIQARISEVTVQQDRRFLQEANSIVLTEIDLAFGAAPDFEHTFVIPNSPANTYTINITNNREVVSRYEDLSYVNFFAFNVTGHLHAVAQNNTVYSVDGIVELPSGQEIFLGTPYTGVFMNVNPERCYLANLTSSCADTAQLPSRMRPFCQRYFSLC